jgi:CDP-glycerol glycerophosphotransferase (TagB/SpsB family)
MHAVVFPLRLLIGWGILVPLSYLIPKNNNIIFITRFSNNFDGNLKYLFLYFADRSVEGADIYFLTSDRNVKQNLKDNNLSVLFYPSVKTILKLFRAGTIIVDGNEWIQKFKYYLLFNTRKIQLWHGSGMKTIGLLKSYIMNINPLAAFALAVIGNHPLYDLVILNSTFQKNTRAKAFKYKDLLINGQPRNDVFFKDNLDPYLVGIDDDVYSKCIKYKKEGYKLAAYCPTHRDPSEAFLALKDTLNIERLDRFAAENKIIFIFKYHPKTLRQYQYDLSSAANIFDYNKTSDIYPLLAKCDLMITDYSSIFVDYLLLDKPVVFFPFDYDNYVGSERPLQFDYETVTPGTKCFTYNELEADLKKTLVDGIDDYKDARREVVKKFFDTLDGNSCDRIWDYIQKTNDK